MTAGRVDAATTSGSGPDPGAGGSSAASAPAAADQRAVSVDYGNMLAGVLEGPGGFDSQRLAGRGDLAGRFRGAFDDVEGRRATGEMAFFDVPSDRAAVAAALAAARAVRRFDALVVIGIGGSAVGAKALGGALLPPFWNEMDAAARAAASAPAGAAPRGRHPVFPRPRLYVLDNPDPATVSGLLARLDLHSTAINVVSKSGATAETMANFMVAWERLRRAAGEDAGRRLVVTTGRAGPLRRLARDLGATWLPAPDNVGGRFSALSSAGLMPAAAVGVDVRELLDGAGEMALRCATPVLRDNPAGMIATLLHAAHAEGGASVHVLMPYADRLRWFAAWFQQLWAESLGKALDRSGAVVETGPTPLPAVGATDQHSVVQLLMEGPRDKVVVFVACRSPDEDVVAVPAAFPREAATSYLQDRNLFQLLDGGRRATADALRRSGRLNMTVAVDALNARSLGGLLMLFQIAVAYAGSLYGVDPLNQPGVELGKRIARELLGASEDEALRVAPPDPRWQV